MTRVHQNSITAFHNLRISEKQARVMSAFSILGESTDEEIREYLGWPINCVTGRISELKQKGIIVETRTIKGPCGQPRRVCRLRNNNEKLF